MPTNRIEDEFAHELAAMFGQRSPRRTGQPSPDPNSPDFDPALLAQAKSSDDATVAPVDMAQLSGDAPAQASQAVQSSESADRSPDKLGGTTPTEVSQDSAIAANSPIGAIAGGPGQSETAESRPNMAENSEKLGDFLNSRSERADESPTTTPNSPNPPDSGPQYPPAHLAPNVTECNTKASRESGIAAPTNAHDASDGEQPDWAASAETGANTEMARPGRKPKFEPYYEALTSIMADGTTLAQAAAQLGLKLSPYQRKLLYKARGFKTLYRRKRQAWSDKKLRALERAYADRMVRESKAQTAALYKEFGIGDDY